MCAGRGGFPGVLLLGFAPTRVPARVLRAEGVRAQVGRVRWRVAIGICTHALVALVVPVVAGRRVCARARVGLLGGARASGAGSTYSSRAEGVRARVGWVRWRAADLHPRTRV